ncbi:MAG TPA: tetratricopeptide repeat protein [Micropepsaceae bacterium]|nr:tetratricopeptide repeat protein [Micropepsaceae bacterium]
MATDTAHPDSSGDELAQSNSDKAMLAARDDAKSIRKKPTMPAPLEQVMKEVAPDASNAGSIGRVERRIMMLEKAFAEVVERHEKSLRERVGAVSTLEENLLVLRNRLDQSEKHHNGAMTELRSALANARMRLNGVEAAQSPAPQITTSSFPDPLPGRVAMVEDADTGQSEVSFSSAFAESSDMQWDEIKADEMPAQPESWLSAARRAANESVVPLDEKNLSRAQQPRRASRTRLLLLGCAAPLVIVAAFVFVLNRHAVTAETVAIPLPPVTAAPGPGQTVPLVPLAAPEVVVAPSADPAPSQLASSVPIGELEAKAKEGDAKAARDLGLRYLAGGDGLATNEAEAARWLLSAAYKGEPTAEYWLGTLYARGRGVPADAFQASHWYEAGAKQGNLRAMHSLAVANFEGWGREKDYVEAAKWFEKAAQLGSVDSQYNLAVLYERGTGVPKSLSDAYRWYAIAAAGGDKESHGRVAAVAKQLSKTDLEAAIRAATGFKPQRADETANAATGLAPPPSGG